MNIDYPFHIDHRGRTAPTEDDDHIRDSKHSRIFGPMDRAYARMLDWSMAHRAVVAVLAVLVLFSSVPLFRFVNVNFITQDDQSGFDVSVRALEGTSLVPKDAFELARGSTYWVELSSVPIADTSGNVSHWVSVQRDISDRKRMEQAFFEEKELAQVTLQSIGDAVTTPSQ